MKAVDEEMADGGVRYTPEELLDELGIA